LVVTLDVLTTERLVCAQVVEFDWAPVEIFRNNESPRRVYIYGNHVEYQANGQDYCDDPGHRTSEDNPFRHAHVSVPDPLEAYVVSYNASTDKYEYESIGTFTLDDVRAYWDDWFAIDSAIGYRENVVSFGCYGSEDLTYNCWGYSLGYDTWIQNPDPIYRDDYDRLLEYPIPEYPMVEDVIKLEGHVVTITSVEYWLPHSPFIVVGTREKYRHSGIYYFLYDSPMGFFHYGFGGYYRKK